MIGENLIENLHIIMYIFNNASPSDLEYIIPVQSDHKLNRFIIILKVDVVINAYFRASRKSI